MEENKSHSHTLPSTLEVHSDNEFENIEFALMEAVYISRWTASKSALYAVLTPEETQQIVKDIFIELDKIGYEIRKK
jgi:hypothetical protein